MSRIPTKIRAQLHERARDCCEICGRHGATNAHHRKNQSQGGQNVLSNLMLLCGSGTIGCHGIVTTNPVWARRWGYAVRGCEDPGLCPVLVDGWVLLGDDGSVTHTNGEVA